MEVFDIDTEIVPSSLQEIVPILLVANKIQHERPRVAYICRWYAYMKAGRLDPSSSGHGVRQFKTAFFQRIERENVPSLHSRVKRTDAREIKSFYNQYYEKYVTAIEQDEKADKAQLRKAYQVAGVLYEVLCHAENSEKITEVAPQTSRSAATTTFSMEVVDTEIVPSSIQQISLILCVANEIQNDRPRAAYLCRFYAFKKAHRLDQRSSGRGVRQFKMAILQRLERDNAPSLASRVKKTDAGEIYNFYRQYYTKYIIAIEKDEKADKSQLGKAYQVAGVLFDVYCAVERSERVKRSRT